MSFPKGEVTTVAAPALTALYLGSAFLGADKEILAPLRSYAEHYEASVTHLGPLATDDEIKMWRWRTQKLATWDKQLKELTAASHLTPDECAVLVADAYRSLVERGSKQVALVDWDDVSEDELSEHDIKCLQRLLQAKVNVERLRAELKWLLDMQEQRVEALSSYFPGISFSFSKSQVLDFDKLVEELGTSYVGTEIHSRHLVALSMPANGPKISHVPITARTIAAISASTSKSAVMPHPIPMTESRASEGLNNARNYFTTGGLRVPEAPTSTLDLHKGKHLPGAVVCVYADDGSFFANNIIVETRKGVTPFIGEDGLFFTAKGVSEVIGTHNAITINDTHAPYEHPGVVNAAIYCGRLLKALTLILNGDIIDHEADNRHGLGKPGLTEGKRTVEDLGAGRRLVNRLIDGIGAKDVWWILGNHEAWLTQLVERHPSLIGLLDWDTIAKDWFGRVKFIMRKAGGNTLFRFGSLTPRHGDEESLQAAIEALGDVINAHWHRHYRIGQSGIVGAGCRLGPAYVGNNLTAWQSQFASHVKHQELTQTSYKTVLHNDEAKTSRFAFRNQIVTVGWGAA